MRSSPAGGTLQGKDSAKRLSGRRLRRAFYLVLLAVLIGLLISYWSWVDAQVRGVVVISSVLDAPVLTPAVEAAGGDPRFSQARVAGNPSLVVRPAGERPWPAIFLVNGAVREGRKLPEVRNLAEGFARAGYLVVVPDLPGLTEARITPQTADATTQVAREISGRHDVEDGKVALVGVSTGATLALLAAEDPALRGKISLVAGVAPYSNIKTVVRLLANRNPERFAALYANLPDDVRHDLEELSPLAGTEQIRVPVELVTGPRDKYFPPSQSYALERVAPQRRVTVTGALDHAKLEVSPEDIQAFATFDAFVVRSLRT